VSLVLGAQTSHVAPFAAVLALGFIIGVVGHIIRSRPLIIMGILVVGAVSAYFAFVVAKVR
jgi:hypothetical protein